MKKPLLSLNLLWTAIATGTFFAGSLWRGENSGGHAPDNRRRVLAAPGTTGTLANLSSKTTAAQDAELNAFMERFGGTNGKPLSPDNMRLAISEAMRETDPIKSQMLFGRLMASLTAENAPAALAMIRENAVGFESMRYMGMLAYAWGGVDPKGAMEVLGSNTGNERGGRMVQGTALTSWAAKDPTAALAWLETYKGENKNDLAQSLIGGLAKSDFAAALKYAGALEGKDDRARAAQTLAREMIRSGGVEGATTWLASLTDPSMKSSAFETVSQQLQRSDPEAAAAFIRKNASEPYAAGAAASLAASLSRRDMQQGLDFAASLTGASQSRAYSEIISRWMETDNGAQATQASEYVNKMPAGPARDAGAAIIAREVSREDPAASIAWASTISDPVQREQLLVQAARRYLRADPAAGATWLAQSGLSPEAQQQVTAPREDRRAAAAANNAANPDPSNRNNFQRGMDRREFGNDRRRGR